jgi:hypothetical protein
MEILSNPKTDPLVEIVVDREGLQIMMNAAQSAITQANEWNTGDEYDTDVTPYHEMYNSLKELYDRFYQETKD